MQELRKEQVQKSGSEAAATGLPALTPFEIGSFEDVLAGLRRKNPNRATDRPQDIDWQELKARARISPCA